MSSWQLLQLRKNVRGLLVFAVSLTLLSQLPGLWAFTKPAGEPLSIELIQGNFAQHLVFSREGMFRQIQFYENAMIHSHAQLVVSPETSLPWPEMSLPIGTLDRLQDLANQKY